ncbi:hypothetical protein D9758_002886 [Tetrapyrgos nigripes]|uniref:Uncharacterized protein n=1 Tax=Tetrapyrgos nigripes TaxID=182062 RepID=A0A8H5GQP1_9AGAR|nr:hypothetical protein D9758_002886 [Tetrapyrgos nigripes]
MAQSSFVEPITQNGAPKEIQDALNPLLLDRRIKSISDTATLLIEKHADLNMGAFGYTPHSGRRGSAMGPRQAHASPWRVEAETQ